MLADGSSDFGPPLLSHALLERVHDVDDLRYGFAFGLDSHLWRSLLDLSAKIFMQRGGVLRGFVCPTLNRDGCSQVGDLT
jgi:hypothetical protein